MWIIPGVFKRSLRYNASVFTIVYDKSSSGFFVLSAWILFTSDNCAWICFHRNCMNSPPACLGRGRMVSWYSQLIKTGKMPTIYIGIDSEWYGIFLLPQIIHRRYVYIVISKCIYVSWLSQKKKCQKRNRNKFSIMW